MLSLLGYKQGVTQRWPEDKMPHKLLDRGVYLASSRSKGQSYRLFPMFVGLEGEVEKALA